MIVATERDPRGRKPTCLCGACDKCKRREPARIYHKTYQRDYYHGIRRPRPAPHQWTAEEDSFLGQDTDAEVARALGMTTKAVESRRRRLGIAKHVIRGLRKGLCDGYVEVVLAPDDPLIEMTRKSRSVLEHRLVMARHLGRPLTRDEFVHHKNGFKTDNRIENLELWTRSHPDGQRVEDVLAWAREFVERYSLDQSIFRSK